MLVIRKAQLDALVAARLSTFESKMMNHLVGVFPDWARGLGSENLRDFVRHGMDRAGRYGFQVELDVARYLHVMRDLGRDFDTSPDHPWAAELLRSSTLPASEKMDRLRDAARYQVEAKRIVRAR